jgi:hypothetical protein
MKMSLTYGEPQSFVPPFRYSVAYFSRLSTAFQFMFLKKAHPILLNIELALINT